MGCCKPIGLAKRIQPSQLIGTIAKTGCFSSRLETALSWHVELGGVSLKALLYLAVVLDQPFDVVEFTEANEALCHGTTLEWYRLMSLETIQASPRPTVYVYRCYKLEHSETIR